MKMLLTRTMGPVMMAGALAMSANAWAEDVDHFEGKKPESLEEAVSLFKEYNAKFEEILSDRPLSDEQLAEIHRISYTMENALGKMNSEMLSLTQTLESIHKASERGDTETVTGQGQSYLSTSRKLTD